MGSKALACELGAGELAAGELGACDLEACDLEARETGQMFHVKQLPTQASPFA